MQIKKTKHPNLQFPEYFLFWTFDHPDFLEKSLQTYEKESLEFLDKGVPNNDNGPDYQNAVIKVGDTLMRGDLEFHRNWQDWFRHGHENDRRYDQVILHIVWTPPENLPGALTRRFPHFVISRYLNLPPDQWLKSMELLKNQAPPVNLSASNLNSVPFNAKKLAWRRFLRKCAELRYWITEYGWETALYLSLAKALGYNKNSQPFVQLVKLMPPAKLIESVHPLQRSPLIIWILLAWQSGLLQRPLKNSMHHSPSYPPELINHIKRQFAHIFTLPSQNLIQWNFARLRPHNNPYNRLAGYSQILYHYQNRSLFKILLEIHMKRVPLKHLIVEVHKTMRIPLSTDLKLFFIQLFGHGSFSEYSIGLQRCQLFHLNLLLPLFYIWAEVNHNPGFARYLEDLYYQYPAVDRNSRLQQLMGNLKTTDQKYAFGHQALLEYYQLNFIRQQFSFQKRH
jgi:hypothetical protein